MKQENLCDFGLCQIDGILVASIFSIFTLQSMAQNVHIIPSNSHCEPFVVSSELSAFIMSYHDGGSVSLVAKFYELSGIDAYKISNWVSSDESEDSDSSIDIEALLDISQRVLSYCTQSNEWQASLRPAAINDAKQNVMITMDTLISWQKEGIPTNLNDPLRDYMRTNQFIQDWSQMKDALLGLRDCSTTRIQLIWL